MRPHYANEKDTKEVQDLLQACGLAVDGVAEHIGNFLVVRDNAGLLGCAGVENYGQVAVLRSVAVAERARSAGLGELLVAAMLAEARTRGVQSVVLQTTTAVDYFARLGFEPVERACMPQELLDTALSREACPASATLMQAAL
ncbi:arsenic resistance N-acetyltransferase ArsN2 [Cupriavidus sp. CV2]|uniref:arsenic resistance N-acetyltransferase ArsN2 n=1 Tax=Cupriavidus TaxID=106589 RepID=UPI00296AE33E|nr:arsenic resistance N-acetyltransferase ArsN2 [Cupriavidus sp. CV2]MDW3684572.1 arsenic resistance N-acetyltransferase ArsN2 [Cupriavidus sp. CV2]